MSPNVRARPTLSTEISRRRFVVGAMASAGAAAPLATTTAQPATPAASAISPEDLLTLSTRIVGGGKLDEAAAEPLAHLLASDPALVAGVEELVGLSDISPDTLQTASAEAQRAASNVLQYWYLGRFEGEPVANRADILFGLASWRALPYVTQPTVCKGFGYWAADIDLTAS